MMKTLMIVLLVSSVWGAQSNYEMAIQKGKAMINDAETADDYQAAANYFERVAAKEHDEWLPLYYQAQSLAFMGNRQENTDSKEQALNRALELIKKAKALAPNAELVALEGFVQMLRLTVDPAARGQTLSPVIFALFRQALAMDSDNPRALLFMGQMEYGTAQFFGESSEEACTFFSKAIDIVNAKSDEDSIFPSWGHSTALKSMELCSR